MPFSFCLSATAGAGALWLLCWLAVPPGEGKNPREICSHDQIKGFRARCYKTTQQEEVSVQPESMRFQVAENY